MFLLIVLSLVSVAGGATASEGFEPGPDPVGALPLEIDSFVSGPAQDGAGSRDVTLIVSGDTAPFTYWLGPYEVLAAVYASTTRRCGDAPGAGGAPRPRRAVVPAGIFAAGLDLRSTPGARYVCAWARPLPSLWEFAVPGDGRLSPDAAGADLPLAAPVVVFGTAPLRVPEVRRRAARVTVLRASSQSCEYVVSGRVRGQRGGEVVLYVWLDGHFVVAGRGRVSARSRFRATGAVDFDTCLASRDRRTGLFKVAFLGSRTALPGDSPVYRVRCEIALPGLPCPAPARVGR